MQKMAPACVAPEPLPRGRRIFGGVKAKQRVLRLSRPKVTVSWSESRLSIHDNRPAPVGDRGHQPLGEVSSLGAISFRGARSLPRAAYLVPRFRLHVWRFDPYRYWKLSGVILEI